MKTFEEHLQQDCGGYPLRTILDNLTDDQIIDAVNDYAKQVAQDALNRAAENAVVNQEIFKDKSIITVYKPSIVSTEIILP